jgi:RNA polymerase sigma factor (sigma-70 family)
MTQVSKAVEGARKVAVAGLTDAELLSCFLEHRDEAAFAALVQRHGPMVWNACRRLLNEHDAEDAFQVVFLVLFRRAASIMPRKMLANWLYGVAHQTSLHVRRTTARRRTRERQVVMAEPAMKETDALLELRGVLDVELSRLPDRYRAVIVLCDLEGKTQKEAARQLGRPEGTVAGQLARGRAMLARRLARRGLGTSGGAVTAMLSQQASAVPTSVVTSTIHGIAMQAVPAKIVGLADGVIKAMLLTKLKAALAIVLMLGFMTTGATLACRTTGQEGKNPAVEKSVEQEAFTAWGNKVGGLQAGLSIINRDEIQTGGKATAVVKLRNVSNKAITASVWPLWLPGPQVVDSQGKQVRATRAPHPLFEIIPTKITLQPGQIVEVAKSTIFVAGVEDEDQPVPEGVVDQFTIYVRPGTFKAKFAGFLQGQPALATGEVEFNVKDAVELTAWGKEVGGLQAGLGYLPGQKRAYHTLENVKLVVRVRNLSKEIAKFKYLRQFFIETPPTVTDGNGKPVQLPHTTAFGQHFPAEVNLAPGKEIELYELEFKLGPASEIGNNRGIGVPRLSTLYGTGKFAIQYDRAGGPSSGNPAFQDPILSKLATGKLELLVRDAEMREDDTAWGKQAGGLQAGLTLHPEQRVFHYGDTITLTIRVRNVSKEIVKFEYLRQFLDENPPTVTDAGGKMQMQRRVLVEGSHSPVEVSLAPGQEIRLQSRMQGAELKYQLMPSDQTRPADKFQPMLVRKGKISIQFRPVLGDSSSREIKVDPALSRLATGKLEIEVEPKAQDDTTWGKEVDGLLCRLRVDKAGDVPSFTLTVRNLGKRDLQMHMAQDGCEIEFDGTWFRWLGPVSIIGGPWPAGRRYDDFEIHVSLGRRWQDSAGTSIKLTPGKHRVRVAYVTLDRTPVRAVSNPVEIEIAAPKK